MPEIAALAGLRASRPEAIGEAADRLCLGLSRPGVTGLFGTPDDDMAAAVDTAAGLLEGAPACR